MSDELVRLEELCDVITKGTTPTTLGLKFSESGIPFLRVQNISGGKVNYESDVLYIDKAAHETLERSKICPGDVLVSIAGTIGRAAVVPRGAPELNCNQALAILRPKSSLFGPFLRHWLESTEARRQISGATVTGTISNLSLSQIGSLKVPSLPVEKQRRIAQILDKADALRAKRHDALAQLDALAQSIFLDLFGDPALNPLGWPRKTIGELAAKFSDGPFGSNLKTSHYTESGVRVVRLQNIGVGKFIDDDRAFISERHFAELAKHECKPGDVLIGTLGDPNLRACIQPEWLKLALNKADCVQFRPEERLANAEYVCALLNLPATGRMTQDLALGQTRLRISMGRLRGLQVPVPPLEMQIEFTRRIKAIEKLRSSGVVSSIQLHDLFSSIQQRAFAGAI